MIENDPVDRKKRLVWRTAADRGLVEKPVLAPHYGVRKVEEGIALLFSETFSALLAGQRYLDILPLLDGVSTRHDIARALAGRHTALEVHTALASMAARSYIVSGDFHMSRKMAAFWSTLGATPRWAEERLGAARLALNGPDPGLGAALASMGLRVVEADGSGDDDDAPTLHLVLTDDYLDESHAETNRCHLASGTPWILIKVGGMMPLIGPVFRPADEGAPCWSCLAHRLRGNREVDTFLRTVDGPAAAMPPSAVVPPLEGAMRNLAALEIAKWIVVGESSLLHGRVVSAHTLTFSDEGHSVVQRPQCAVCGDFDLRRPDREALPVRLRPSPKPVRNSGGTRSVPPEQTVRRYRHLVSPISGVVTQIQRLTGDEDPWLHVYWAGSNLALKNDRLHLLRNSLRSKSSGKGSTGAQSKASALCEAIERYCGVFQGDEIRQRGRLADFLEGDAIHPNTVQMFSDRQYERAEEINALGSRFNHVPIRFDPTVEMDWSPVWSLSAGRQRWLPTSMLYFSVPPERGLVYCAPDSNGCAAGNTLEEAILQGFFELAERDAFACWWYNRVSLPEVDLDSFGDSYLSDARGYYASFNRDLWVLDATNDLGIPAFIGISRRIDKEAEDILFSAGAHLDPRIAALRAVCELNQYLSLIRDVGEGGDYAYHEPESLWWWRTARLSGHAYLAPDRSAPARRAADYPVPDTDDVKDDVELCRAIVERKGMEFLVLDQTRPDVGMPVARIIVPGMRHFWARFGPGRLYDVPVETGWLDAPRAETELNPIPVFI